MGVSKDWSVGRVGFVEVSKIEVLFQAHVLLDGESAVRLGGFATFVEWVLDTLVIESFGLRVDATERFLQVEGLGVSVAFLGNHRYLNYYR